MPAERQVHIVDDPGDSGELPAMLNHLADTRPGMAVCHITPGLARPGDLAADVLVCLGKRFDALRVEQAGKRAWQLVNIWLQAERTRHLFVLRAHHLNRRLAELLISTTGQSRTELWFLTPTPTPSLSTGRRWTKAAFLDRWTPAGQTSVHQTTQLAALPDVPADDFVTFRAACKRRLPPADFDRIDALYCATMDAATAWLHARGPRRPMRGSGLTAADVAAQVHNLLSSSADTTEALVCLRGAQAAFFFAGWHVDYDPPVVNPHNGMAPLAPTITPGVVRRVRRLCTPRAAAALTLRLATNLSSEGLCALNVDDIDDGATAVTVDRQALAIPPYAASLVLAQVIERKLDGAQPGGPLFVNTRTGQRCVASGLRNVLRRACSKVGVAAAGSDSFAAPRHADQLLVARGIRVAQHQLPDSLYA